MTHNVLLIEACNFVDYPVGGQLSTAKRLLRTCGDQLALVGVSTDDRPVGQWTTQRLEGFDVPYFSIGRVNPDVRKPLVPRRLDAFLRLRRYHRQILSLGARAAFVIAPEVMIAIENWGLRVAYTFSGVENPLTMPRYAMGRWLAEPFERRLFSALASRAELIMANADEKAIRAMKDRSAGVLDRKSIISYPTHVDTAVFHLGQRARAAVGPRLVSCGRLNAVKGWDLVLDAFSVLKSSMPNARLCYVGDGEDRSALEARVRALGFESCVQVTGFIPPERVASILNASDLYLVGSHREGWPTALLEAEACGLPVVVTDVSGASTLVQEGRNGFIVRSREPREFAAAIQSALKLQIPNPVSLAIAQRYALDNFRSDLAELWEPFRARPSTGTGVPR